MRGFQTACKAREHLGVHSQDGDVAIREFINQRRCVTVIQLEIENDKRDLAIDGMHEVFCAAH